MIMANIHSHYRMYVNRDLSSPWSDGLGKSLRRKHFFQVLENNYILSTDCNYFFLHLQVANGNAFSLQIVIIFFFICRWLMEMHSLYRMYIIFFFCRGQKEKTEKYFLTTEGFYFIFQLM